MVEVMFDTCNCDNRVQDGLQTQHRTQRDCTLWPSPLPSSSVTTVAPWCGLMGTDIPRGLVPAKLQCSRPCVLPSFCSHDFPFWEHHCWPPGLPIHSLLFILFDTCLYCLSSLRKSFFLDRSLLLYSWILSISITFSGYFWLCQLS
jgi:hypothetical protein